MRFFFNHQPVLQWVYSAFFVSLQWSWRNHVVIFACPPATFRARVAGAALAALAAGPATRLIPFCPGARSREGGADQPERGILHPEEQQTIVEAHQLAVSDVGPAAAGLAEGQLPNRQLRRQALQ